MSPVELPRPIEDYFAHAELEASAAGRRFSITLPYFDGARLERVQWWWQLGRAQERQGDDETLASARAAAAARFRVHIETWLGQHRFVLTGDDPIPRLHRRSADAGGATEDRGFGSPLFQTA